MKKFSTRSLTLISLSLIWGWGTPVQAQALAGDAAGVPQAATPASPGARNPQPLELAANAPDRHVVVKGDTLWDISGKFLQQPWRWPEIWQLNREQIRDPHWIYPGNVVYLDTSSGQPRLRLGQPVGDAGSTPGTLAQNTIKMQPTVRVESLRDTAIPTVSSAMIAAFVNRPLVVTETQMLTSPRVIGTQDGRVNLGRGDLMYVRGIKDSTVTDWHVYRQARPILDPDTRKPIAFEALFVGSVRLERLGDPSTLRVTGTSEEIGAGDRLVPAELGRPFNFVPHPPAQDVKGRIVSIYKGVSHVGRNSVVAVSLGSQIGIEEGHVLAIKQRGREILDPVTRERLRLPDEPTGHLLIFRVFDSIAYGLVTAATDSIQVGDLVVNP